MIFAKDMDPDQIITLDFETFFDAEYSLKKMKNFEYVTDPRFKAHGCSVKVGQGRPMWVSHADLPSYFRNQDWSKSYVLMANAYFDALIMLHHYEVKPGFVLDVKGMGNMLVRPFTMSASVDAIAKHYGIESKLNDGAALVATKGIRNLPIELEDDLALYANQDVNLERKEFDLMLPQVQEEELDLINLHVQMYLSRLMRIDRDKMEEVDAAHKAYKKDLHVDLLMAWPDIFAVLNNKGEYANPWAKMRKNDVVATLIKRTDNLPPRKRSKKTGKLAYAFAKTDVKFQALQGMGDLPELIVKAKTAANSTMLEAKIQRLLMMHDRMGGWAHPLVNYGGAHTLRGSGGDGINFQALPKEPEGFRHAFVAPENHTVIVGDSGQIEARGLAWLADHTKLLNIFRESDALSLQGIDPKDVGKDVYTVMAHDIGSDSRDLGKAVTLGCGFGLSENGFVLNVRARGNTMPEGVLRAGHAGWTEANQPIVKFWGRLMETFETCALAHREVTLGHLHFEPYRDGLIVWLPSGRPFIYGGVRQLHGELIHNRGKLWHGLVVENVTQALCRDIVFYQALQFPEVLEYLWLLVHDELDLVVPNDKLDHIKGLVEKALRFEHPWAKGLPTFGSANTAPHLFKD